jgi:hypothetical protein
MEVTMLGFDLGWQWCAYSYLGISEQQNYEVTRSNVEGA